MNQSTNRSIAKHTIKQAHCRNKRWTSF